MPTEPELVGLLQRADWTNLSLAATVRCRFNRALRDELLRSMPPPWASPWVRVMQDPDDLPMALGEEVTGTLIVAPARRFRAELADESGETVIKGCDGDRVWLVRTRPSAAGPRRTRRNSVSEQRRIHRLRGSQDRSTTPLSQSGRSSERPSRLAVSSDPLCRGRRTS